jgi:hypothetical protein
VRAASLVCNVFEVLVVFSHSLCARARTALTAENPRGSRVPVPNQCHSPA